MSSKKQNVLVLTVDTWRADRLGLYGYSRPTTPVLDKFAKEAVVCDNAFTLGPFTQVACIQLFTSSRPLSYGGYDKGAGGGRPENLFSRFQQAGYHTSGLSTIHWVSPYYGYTQGLDKDVSLILLNTLAGMAYNNMRDTVIGYHTGNVTEERMLSIVEPVMYQFFDNLNHYCNRMMQNEWWMSRSYPESKAIKDGYNFQAVKDVAHSHKTQFESDPVGYIEIHLREAPDPHEWIARDWRYARKPGKLIVEAAQRLISRTIGSLIPNIRRSLAFRYRMSVDAHTIAGKVGELIHDRPSDRPFFIWAHFKDTHMPYVSGPGSRWFDHTSKYLEELGHDRTIEATSVFDPGITKRQNATEILSPLYDASIRSTDEAIGTIFEHLQQSGEASNTIVAICGDHGEEIGDHGDYGHRIMPFEHNARIPMMFSSQNMAGERIKSLVTTMDFSPTICEIAGIHPALGWEGRPVWSEDVAGREYILMEAFCRGNCDFKIRAPYLAVRTHNHKYIWYEFIDPHHSAGVPGPMLFDLQSDPGEQKNIYSSDHPLVPSFNRIMANRLREIPEYPAEKISALFNELEVAPQNIIHNPQ